MDVEARQAKLSKKGYKTTGGERASYGLYFVGQNIFYIFIYFYLATFFLDVGIGAYAVSFTLLIVKVWDAVNDPIFGGMVDRIRFKNGKFIPWLRISLVFIPLATIFMFAIPSGIPEGAKIAWAVIGYILWDTAYTICDVPIFGLVTTMTDNQNERTSIMAIGRVCAMVASAIVAIGVPYFRQAIGGWLPTIILLSVIAVITMVPVCFKAKERIQPKVTNEKGTGFKEMFQYLISNKYLLIFYTALFVGYASNIQSTISLIFARECLGEESMQSLLSLASMIPAILLGMFIPVICKKIDKFHLYFWSMAVSAVLGLITYFVGYQDLTAFLVLSFLRGIPLGVYTITMFMFTPDCAEYGHYKTGINATGITFAIQTFSVKLMTAVATALGTFCLGLIGYVKGEGAVQAAGFADKLWTVYSIIPTIGMIISVLILFRYKLRDKDVAVMAKYNAGEITREEADRQIKCKL